MFAFPDEHDTSIVVNTILFANIMQKSDTSNWIMPLYSLGMSLLCMMQLLTSHQILHLFGKIRQDGGQVVCHGLEDAVGIAMLVHHRVVHQPGVL